MIIGCLAIGLLCAVVSALASLMTGFGMLAAAGFYMLGGTFGLIGAACLIAYTPRTLNRSNPDMDGLVGEI